MLRGWTRVRPHKTPLIPAKAGTQADLDDTGAERDPLDSAWVPAFAGMSGMGEGRAPPKPARSGEAAP
jgi:hypothetical protein